MSIFDLIQLVFKDTTNEIHLPIDVISVCLSAGRANYWPGGPIIFFLSLKVGKIIGPRVNNNNILKPKGRR